MNFHLLQAAAQPSGFDLEKLFFAVVAALLPTIIGWFSNRSKARSREHHIVKLSSELEFLERVADLSEVNRSQGQAVLASDSPSLIQHNLNRILDEFRLVSEEEQKEQNGPPKLPLLRSSLLLFWPSGFKGWLIHIVFWWFTFGVITAPFNAALALETGGEDFLLLIGTMILIYGPILFFLQRAVVRRRKRLLEKELELAAA